MKRPGLLILLVISWCLTGVRGTHLQPPANHAQPLRNTSGSPRKHSEHMKDDKTVFEATQDTLSQTKLMISLCKLLQKGLKAGKRSFIWRYVSCSRFRVSGNICSRCGNDRWIGLFCKWHLCATQLPADPKLASGDRSVRMLYFFDASKL